MSEIVYVTKKTESGKTEIPEELLKKFHVCDDTTIEWYPQTNGEVILRFCPKKVY